MGNRLLSLAYDLQRSLSHLDREQWLLVSVGVLVIGIFCMRGFGSRTRY